MRSEVANFPVAATTPRMPRIESEPYAEPISDVAHTEKDMPPRRLNEDDVRMIAEVVRQTNNGSAKMTQYLLGAVAIISLVGSAGNFLFTYGRAEGGDKQLIKQAADDHARLDHLRDLYMIRFNEDPDTVDTSTMKKKPKK